MKVFAVIGEPIHHSLSPIMHQRQFDLQKLQAKYVPLLVKKGELKEAVEGLRALNISGFNVTIPHKESIFPFLDEVDEVATAIGAVNTVVRRGEKLIGTNTDASGFIASLKEAGFDASGKQVLVLGAGGASRAIIYALLQEGVRGLDVANRTVSKAVDCAEDFGTFGSVRGISLEEAGNDCKGYDLIVNTTSVGLANTVDTPLVGAEFSSSTLVVDIIYNPYETRLLREARACGCQVLNGIGMFIYQGAHALKFWLDIKPDVEMMRQTVLGELEGK